MNRSKKPTFKISIPEACHENWNTMTPTQKGRHCASCEKEVIDFTSKSNEELFKLIDNGENMCGRFRSHQLDTPLQLKRKEKNSIAKLAASVAIPLTLLLSNEVTAQDDTPKTETVVQTSKAFTSLGIGVQHRELKTSDKYTITGTVSDDTGLPLPGVNVEIKGTRTGTQTDFDGNYAIEVSNQDTLFYSYVGYQNHELEMKSKQKRYDTVLKIGNTVLEVIVTGGYRISESVSGNSHIFGWNYSKDYEASKLRRLAKRNQKVAYELKKNNKQ